jgi:hypothetical protein
VLDWTYEDRIRRTAGVPRGGGQWCMEQQICKDRALFKGGAFANKGVVGFWAWIFDAPTRQTYPACCPLYVPASTTMSLDWTAAPRLMSQGIYVAASSDPQTFTIIVSPDAWFEIAYEAVR